MGWWWLGTPLLPSLSPQKAPCHEVSSANAAAVHCRHRLGWLLFHHQPLLSILHPPAAFGREQRPAADSALYPRLIG